MLFQSHESNFEISFRLGTDISQDCLVLPYILRSTSKSIFARKTHEYWILYVKRLVGSEKTKNFYIWNCFKNVNVMANTIAWTRLLKSHFFLYFFCFLLSTTTNSKLIGQHWFADCFSQSDLNFGSVEFSRQENVNKQIPFISEFMNTWWIQQHTFVIVIQLVEIQFYSWRFLKSLFCDQCSKSNPFS